MQGFSLADPTRSVDKPFMHRWVSAFFLVSIAVAVAALVLGRDAGRKPSSAATPEGSGVVLALDASGVAVPVAPLSLPSGATAEPMAAFTGDLPALPKENPGAGATLLDGTQPEPLPKTAPATVRFGAILVTYRGAEQADTQTRTREAALDQAKKLAEAAQTDFVEAGKRGDVFLGDAGVIPQGFLEPAPQHVLFGLEVGGVGGPVDSPRGFYVFKRLE